MAPPSVPDNGPTSEMFDKMVEIKVDNGTKRKSFTVHQGILRHYSVYFDGALKGHFAESQNGFLVLEEEKAYIFERFVYWLYTGKFDRCADVGQNFKVICRLWVFGDCRQIPLLSNAMINAFRDEFVAEWTLPSNELHYIYENTTPGAGLRRLASWIISNTCGSQTLTENSRPGWPADAMWDVLKAALELRDRGAKKLPKEHIAKVDMCPYHQHEEGTRCEKASE